MKSVYELGLSVRLVGCLAVPQKHEVGPYRESSEGKRESELKQGKRLNGIAWNCIRQCTQHRGTCSEDGSPFPIYLRHNIIYLMIANFVILN